VPLGDVDPNVCRRLRSSSTLTEAALPRPAKHPQGRPPILFTRIEPKQRLLNRPRPQGRPWIFPIINEPFVETLRLRSRPTTLFIYQDLDLDHKVPLWASSQALLLVRHNLDYEVPLRSSS